MEVVKPYPPHSSHSNGVDKDTLKKPPPNLTKDAFEDFGPDEEEASSEENYEEKTHEEKTKDDSYEDKFRKSILDQTKEYSLPEPVISIYQNGEVNPFLTRKSCSLWQGKQKSKKTTVLALAVAAFICGYNNYLEGVHFVGSLDGVILFFDNEQGESYAARTMKLILKLAGVESSLRLIYCDLREFAPNERKSLKLAFNLHPELS